MARERERAGRWAQSDFYGALGLHPLASASEVKKGFRQVALACHPDKVPEEAREAATRRFQLIAEAYEVLANPELRAEYDKIRRLQAPRPQPSRGPASPSSGWAAAGKDRPGATGGWGAGAGRPSPGAESAARTAFEERMFGGYATTWLRCEGCDRRCVKVDMRRCPQCAKQICARCDLCAGCIPEDLRSPPQERREAECRTAWSARAVPERAPSAAQRAARFAAPETDADDVGFRSRQGPGGGEVWRPTSEGSGGAPGPAPEEAPEDAEEPPQPLDAAPGDLLSILMAMGFPEREARAALERCSSLTAAVELMMSRGAGLCSALRPTASDIYGAAESLTDKLQPVASNVYESAVHPAAQGICGAVGGLCQAVGLLGARWAAAPEAGKQAKAESGGTVAVNETCRGGGGEVEATLLAIGYSGRQAQAAARRCSSVEAAVEWIAANPDVEH